LASKAAFVERHRGRLVRDAAAARELATNKLRDTIAALEHARATAVEALEAERWAKEFPAETANASTLQTGYMKGGRLSRAMPGGRTLTSPSALIAWFLDDAAWLDSALGEDGERALDPHERAIWEDTPEGKSAIQLANQRVAAGLKPRDLRQAEWE